MKEQYRRLRNQAVCLNHLMTYTMRYTQVSTGILRAMQKEILKKVWSQDHESLVDGERN